RTPHRRPHPPPPPPHTDAPPLARPPPCALTPTQLAGIAEACADAKHEVVGIVLAGTVRVRSTRSAGRARDAATPVLAVGDNAKGSSG
ncbi:polysaccharide biosynthesis protein, partial [Streptomyces mirabilis]